MNKNNYHLNQARDFASKLQTINNLEDINMPSFCSALREFAHHEDKKGFKKIVDRYIELDKGNSKAHSFIEIICRGIDYSFTKAGYFSNLFGKIFENGKAEKLFNKLYKSHQ